MTTAQTNPTNAGYGLINETEEKMVEGDKKPEKREKV